MNDMTPKTILVVRRDGFKKRMFDDGRDSFVERSLTRHSAVFDLDNAPPPSESAVEETVFVRRWVGSNSEALCASCGCSPAGEYYEEEG